MPEYMAESYMDGADGLHEAALRASAAARELAGEGTSIEHVRSVLLPEDEVCLHFFEAPSAAEVAEALRRAAVAADRIVAAVHEDEEGDE